MPAKNTTKSQKSHKDRIIDAALALAGEQGWGRTSLYDIAQKAGVSLAELFDQAEDKTDILCAYGRRIDRRVIEAMGPPDPDLSPRERLFDIFMERFDVLNEDRAAVTAILTSFRPDPKQAVISLPHLCRSMSWMAEIAGLECECVRGAVKVSALTGLYLKTLRVWLRDDSQDMAQVMAALDRDLERLDRLAGMAGI